MLTIQTWAQVATTTNVVMCIIIIIIRTWFRIIFKMPNVVFVPSVSCVTRSEQTKVVFEYSSSICKNCVMLYCEPGFRAQTTNSTLLEKLFTKEKKVLKTGNTNTHGQLPKWLFLEKKVRLLEYTIAYSFMIPYFQESQNVCMKPIKVM